MVECIVVGAGGFIGAVCRYLIGLIPFNENRLAQSQNSFVFKGRNMRRFYDLFLFRTGNGRFDKGRKGAYCSAVRDSERGVRNGRSIRGTGNHPEGMISGGEISDAFT